jgi:hypothetical protein
MASGTVPRIDTPLRGRASVGLGYIRNIAAGGYETTKLAGEPLDEPVVAIQPTGLTVFASTA